MHGKKILVTGGAGFIGSNLVEALLNHEKVAFVRVLDNLVNGYVENLAPFIGRPDFELVIGDIQNYETCLKACDGIDLISHQAGLGSVPRSVEDPILTNNVNITGTLHVFSAAKESGINRVVFAASSSTYGDSPGLPKVEHNIGKPLSPYAVTKFVNELYADVFARLYDFNFIGLRYFNVFGPKQNAASPYTAVVPLFVNTMLKNQSPTIDGDGLQSRDFTFVSNVVQANVSALFLQNPKAINQIYNIASGKQITLLDLFGTIRDIINPGILPLFGLPRKGDIRHSLADISKAEKLLNYTPEISVREGIVKTVDWYRESTRNKSIKNTLHT